MPEKRKRKRKVIASLSAIAISLALVGLVWAASAYNPFLGPNWGTVIRVTGDLSQAGLSGVDARDATIHWHGLRFYDLFHKDYNHYVQETGVATSSTNRNGYITLSQLSLHDVPGNNGFYFIPATQSNVKKFAQASNGNPEYLWNVVNTAISKGTTHMNDNMHPTIMKDRFGGDWVDVGSLLMFSGGGFHKSSPQWDNFNSNGGVDTPRFETTADTTPKPVINKFVVNGKETATQPIPTDDKSKIDIDGSTFSKYNVEAHIRVEVEPMEGQGELYWKKEKPEAGDPATAKFTGKIDRNKPNDFTVKASGSIDVKSLIHQEKPGKYKLTLRYADSYGRSTTKSLIIDYKSAGAFNLKAISIEKSTKPRNGDIMYVNAKVMNDTPTGEPIKSMVGSKTALSEATLDTNYTYENYQWPPSNSPTYDFPPKVEVLVKDIPVKIPKINGQDPNSFWVQVGINYYNQMPPNEPDMVDPKKSDNFVKMKIDLKPTNDFVAVGIDAGAKDDCTGGTAKFTVRLNLISGDTAPRSVVVRLKLKMGLNSTPIDLGSKTITLKPGEQKVIDIPWTAPNNPAQSYQMEASINVPADPALNETIMTNNVAITSLNLNCFSNTLPACSSDQLASNWQPLRDANDKYIEDAWLGKYKEYLNVGIVGTSGSFVSDVSKANLETESVELKKTGSRQIKSGQGFTFQVVARYYNDFPGDGDKNDGMILDAWASFPKMDGSVETIKLKKISDTDIPDGDPRKGDTNYARFELPPMWVSRKGDEVTPNGSPGSYVSGGKAYYIPIDYKLDEYKFTVKVSAKSVNSRQERIFIACAEDTLKVKDNLLDEIYVRQINPSAPFPKPYFEENETSLMWKPFINIIEEVDKKYTDKEG